MTWGLPVVSSDDCDRMVGRAFGARQRTRIYAIYMLPQAAANYLLR